MARTLQDLRREAGYRSAKDFAAAVGIALSTYNRYENQPEAIPLRQAWAIADFLGCPIDMVVGRDPVDAAAMRGDVQKFYDGLSQESRELMDDYMGYIAHREKKARKRAKKSQRARYESMMRSLKRRFDERAEDPHPYGIVVEYQSPDEYRSAFQRYVKEDSDEKRRAGIERHLEGLEDELREGWLDADGTAHVPTDDEVAGRLEDERQAMEQEQEPRDREVIANIMRAYDERYDEGRSYWLSFLRGEE